MPATVPSVVAVVRPTSGVILKWRRRMVAHLALIRGNGTSHVMNTSALLIVSTPSGVAGVCAVHSAVQESSSHRVPFLFRLLMGAWFATKSLRKTSFVRLCHARLIARLVTGARGQLVIPSAAKGSKIVHAGVLCCRSGAALIVLVHSLRRKLVKSVRAQSIVKLGNGTSQRRKANMRISVPILVAKALSKRCAMS